MVIAPQKMREIVFQLLYSEDFSGSFNDEMIDLLMQELRVSKKVMRSAIATKEAIQLKKEEIDAHIVRHLKSYGFDRIPSVERNVLRLGVYELLYVEELPGKVAIAEALRLTRKFATAEAALFVNAVLDAIYMQEHSKVGF